MKRNQMTLLQCSNKPVCPVKTAASGDTTAGANVNVPEREPDEEATSVLPDGREEEPADYPVPGCAMCSAMKSTGILTEKKVSTSEE